MAINLESALYLDEACRRHRIGGAALMLGRQSFQVPLADLIRHARPERIDRAHGAVRLPRRLTTFLDAVAGLDHAVAAGGPLGYAEPLFAYLGFETVHSVDVSRYEDPTFAFDLNRPGLATCTGRQYDLIFDGGTVEHVFHLPNCLENICDTLRPGGFVLHHAPINNFIDHGFYQPSPSLFVDYYEANGFVVEDVTIALQLDAPGGQQYEQRSRYDRFVALGLAETMRTFGPMMHLVYVLARKVAYRGPPRIPQQSSLGRVRGWRAGLGTAAGEGKP